MKTYGEEPSIRDGVHRSGMLLYLHLKRKLRKGLDTVESLSVEVKGSKVANFTVLVTLLPTLVTYFCHF